MNYKRYRNVKNEMTIEEFGELINKNPNEIIINTNNVLKTSDVTFSCINYIASTIAKMPLNLYEKTDQGKVKVDNDLIYLLKNRPNKYTTSVDFIQTLIANMLIYGNGFAKICTRNGKIHELKILDPQSTELKKTANGWCITTTIDNKLETLNYEQVIHLRDLSLDGVNGISRIEAIKGKISNRANADNKLNKYMSNGLGVKGVITGDIDDNKAKIKLKEGFNKVLQSCQDNIAVLTNGMTYQDIKNSSLADDEFINNLKLTKADICAIFNINPALLGDSEQATNSNLESLKIDFIQSLTPIINKIELEFKYKLLSREDRLNHSFKFNMSSAMRATDLDRATYLIKMVQGGLLTRNEARELDDRNKIEGGDELLMSLNYVPYSRWEEYLDARKGNVKTATDLKGGEE